MPITRRTFLSSSGAAIAGLGLPSLVPCSRVPFAAGRARATFAGTRARASGKVLVLVFLRGGMDGLSLLVPHGEEAYYRLREWIAVPRPGSANGALDLDGRFGLHPAAAALEPHFRAGTGTALCAVGHERNTRSHFEEQDLWETGVFGDSMRADGWLNRHLQTSTGRGPVRAVSFGDALPRILRGEREVYAARGLDELLAGSQRSRAAALAALERAHTEGGPNDSVDRGGRAALAALRELQKVAEAPYASSLEWPATDLARRLRDVARTIRADVGLEVAALDFGGWDTHQDQGGPAGGTFTNLVRELAGALAAFLADLEDRQDDVVVLCVSEFGRTAAQNGTGGTDHGWGNALLAFGGPVLTAGGGAPRPVIGTWPGLEKDELHEGRDLQHTTDFQDVLAEVVSAHLGNEHTEVVLPGREAQPVGLVQA